ncbi:MAG: DUF748 domain-containing protein, partial [Gammaproteobacteria bacterium]
MPFYRRRWMALLAAIAAFLGLLLLVLPLGLSYGLHTWLLDNGGEDVRIEDIDVNLFTGRASIRNLDLAAQGRTLLTIPSLSLDIDWRPLFSRQVVLRSIAIEGVGLSIQQDADGGLTIGGISLPEGDAGTQVPAGQQWHVGVDRLQIDATTIEYQTPDLTVTTRLDTLDLTGIKTWTTEPAPLVLSGTINGAAIRLDGELPPLATGFGYRGSLVLNDLALADYARVAAAAVGALAGRLTMDMKLDVLLPHDQPLQVSQSGMLRVDELQLTQAKHRIAGGSLQWDGDLQITAADTPSVTASGRVQSLALAYEQQGSNLELSGRLFTDLQLDVAQTPDEPLRVSQAGQVRLDGLHFLQAGHRVALDSLQWDGDVKLTVTDAPAVTAGGRVQATSLSYDIGGVDYRMLRMAQLEAGRLNVEAVDAVRVDDLAAQGIVLAEPATSAGTDAVLSAGTLKLDRMQYAGGNVRAGRLQGADIVARLWRDGGGQWRVARILDSLPAAETAAEGVTAQDLETAAAPAEAAQFSLDEVHITGDSAIELRDQSVEPAFSSRLALSDAVIRSIDTAQPEQDSPVSIEGRTSRHSKVIVKGMLRPFAARPTLKLDNRFEGIALTELSPYTVRMLGYQLKSGHLDLDSSLSIDHGSIDSSNRMTLRALEVAPVDNEARAQLESQLSLPLGTALDMLRDKHDTIQLDLPVSGDIDSPDFDISDVVNTAVSKALKKASMTYLTLALQPYGALISVAKLAGEAASRVQLAPVGFSPGQAVLPEAGHDYLGKVADILASRPELNIK